MAFKSLRNRQGKILDFELLMANPHQRKSPAFRHAASGKKLSITFLL